MKLSQLILKTKLVTSLPDMEISGLTSDSRKVQKGFLFAALSGVSFDGRQFIESAIQNEASAILSDDVYLAEKFSNIAFLKSENPHRDLALLAAAFYQKQPSHIAAVTGTNGKTSIADFTRQVLNMMNKKAASLGTLGLIKNNEEPQYAMTTPDPITLHQDLAELRDEGIDYLVMETSSHGLCQYRVGGIEFDVAGFTNLTRDHLDYHKTMENYFNAKKMLFTTFLKKGGSAVLNADCDVFMPLKEACLESGKKVVAYGRKGDVIRLIESQALAHGQKLKLEYYGKKIDLEIPLAGEFQAMNVLCASLNIFQKFTVPKGVWNWSDKLPKVRRFILIMPIRPMLWKMLLKRSVRIVRTSYVFCLVAAVIAIKASVRRWVKLPMIWLT